MRCAGCGAAPAAGDPYGWACPDARPGDDIDHVMVHHLEAAGVPLVTSDHENPFVRYRGRLHAYHRWLGAGRDDSSFVGLVEGLDDAVAEVESLDGPRGPRSDSTSDCGGLDAAAGARGGFRRTPLLRVEALDDAAGGARVWVKDETGNVAGSHKGRHLFGLLILLRVVEELGLAGGAAHLAVASCGNAALAAAVVAAAGGRALDVFIPTDADPAVVARLSSLGAGLTVCRRDGAPGDPCYRAFRAAVDAGAIPFGCQGPDNGLTIDGGRTLAWELAEALPAMDRLVVQVGGGALASACIQGLGVLPRMPVVDTVQTTGAFPLARAYARVVEERDDGPARHRGRYMRAWETAPAGVARGILDDETYDWQAVVAGMVATRGSAVVAEEATLVEANRLARAATGIDVDATGSAGLAGLLTLGRSGLVEPGTDVVVIFTGGNAGRYVML